MQFTGTQLNLVRNFYTQTGNFGFGLNCTLDNTTGVYYVGVSGSQGNIQLTFQSGGIYYNNLFIHSYQPNRQFDIEIQLSTGNTNIIKDDTPMIYGNPRSSGNYNSFYFQRQNASLGATFDLWISGDNAPKYNITNLGYLINSGQNSVTGYFINQSLFPIDVFNSEVNNPQNLTFQILTGIIPANSEVPFVYTGNFSNFNFQSPILTTFNTNFDDANILFTIVDLTSTELLVILDQLSFSFYNNSIIRNLSYDNYSGGILSNNFPTELSFALTYISGTGLFAENNFATSAQFSTTGMGNFAKSGYITGQAIILTGNGIINGEYIINASQFAWATGNVSGFFTGIGTGLATGIGYTGIGIGQFSGIYTGFINNGSGTLLVNGNLSGSANSALSLNYPNYLNATGYLNISNLQYRDFFYIGVQNIPIEKGLQFFNETGLIYYLSGNPEHQVNGVYNGTNIILTSLFSGTLGNGTFIRQGQCDYGFISGSSFLTGGINIGTTGNPIVAISPFVGFQNFILTGSGSYTGLITGNSPGTFFYIKTFTGSWDLLTGTNFNNLISLKTGTSANYNSNTISGTGLFSPNSSMVFQIVNIQDQFSSDTAQFIISGNNIFNPIIQTLTN